jgi:hypothetical protein
MEEVLENICGARNIYFYAIDSATTIFFHWYL